MSREIELTRGKVALVDDADFDHLSTYNWRWMPKANSAGYAIRADDGKTAYMHRDIAGASAEQQVEHKNKNGLDNRRENLIYLPRRIRRHLTPPSDGVIVEQGVIPVRYEIRANSTSRTVHAFLAGILIGIYKTRTEADAALGLAGAMPQPDAPKAPTGPTCPTCGSPTQPEQHYTGGTYRFFACCTRNPEHQATRL